jgi:hypothetical protein
MKTHNLCIYLNEVEKHVTLFLNGWKIVTYVYLDEVDEENTRNPLLNGWNLITYVSIWMKYARKEKRKKQEGEVLVRTWEL